jgi:hypothetical protein
MVETIEESRMSSIGERDDAPELEVESDVEEQGADGASADEGDADEVDQESGEDGDDQGAEDDAGTDDGKAGQPAEVTGKPRSAATIAVQEAKRAAKEAKAEAAEATRRLNELTQQAQGRQTAEDKRFENERVALMAPEEKTDYLLNRQQQDFNARFGALEFRMHDAADRSAFASACARIPAYASIEKDVEAALTQARREGNNPLRETVAKYLIGERAVAKALAGGTQRQKTKGRENIARQTVKQPAGRSDVRPSGERTGANGKDALRQRLEDQQI